MPDIKARISRLLAMPLVHFCCLYRFSGKDSADSVDEHKERRARTHITHCYKQQTNNRNEAFINSARTVLPQDFLNSVQIS